MAPQEQAGLFNFFRYRGKGFPLPLRPFSPQGGDIAAQFPDDCRQARQLVFHAHQQKPAQHHRETKILNKAEHFGNVHLQPHFPSPAQGLLRHHVGGDGTQVAFHRFHDIATAGVENVVFHHHLHGGVNLCFFNAGLRFLNLEVKLFTCSIFEDQIQISI